MYNLRLKVRIVNYYVKGIIFLVLYLLWNLEKNVINWIVFICMILFYGVDNRIESGSMVDLGIIGYSFY